MKKLLLTLLTLSLLQGLVSAQNEDLTKDTEFFHQQTQEYQRWLDQSGLGTVLRVKTIDPRPNELPLYLEFRYKKLDSIAIAWKALKKKFDAEQANTLEEELFFKMIFFMEVPDSLANVQIYWSYDPALDRFLFFRGIYFDGEKVQVDSSDARSADASFNLQIQDFRGLSEVTTEEQKAKLSKPLVFQRIYHFAKQRYSGKPQSIRKPRIEVRDSLETLRFEIKDLDREVLTDAEQPSWCQLIRRWGFADCNWVRRELLSFKVTYQSLSTGGFRLGITIDGKVGSGFYEKIRDNAYKPMDVDFKPYLERYAEKFRLELRKYLITGKP